MIHYFSTRINAQTMYNATKHFGVFYLYLEAWFARFLGDWYPAVLHIVVRTPVVQLRSCGA